MPGAAGRIAQDLSPLAAHRLHLVRDGAEIFDLLRVRARARVRALQRLEARAQRRGRVRDRPRVQDCRPATQQIRGGQGESDSWAGRRSGPAGSHQALMLALSSSLEADGHSTAISSEYLASGV